MLSKDNLLTYLDEFAGVLELEGIVISGAPIRMLKAGLQRSKPHKGLTYNLTGLEFKNISPELFSRTGKWDDDISVRLGMDIRLNQNVEQFKFGNTHSLTVNVEYSALSQLEEDKFFECKGAWHLDFHNQPEKDGDPEYIHPNYHFHHGGKKLSELNDCGQIILLDAPRVMHHPLDLFLSVDFVVSNFCKKEVWKKLRANTTYTNYIKMAQDQWWKLYYQDLANYWNHFGKSGVDDRAICKSAKEANPHYV
ncbi:hypothetical protein FR932_06865 [Moritella marina ATCC 15381]|uniref:Uncharacterized protein n=1 Tax=Moritella marina ATCC 15381 TaxID=1202962 RepID=A0A5J6WKH3_MORMI|nr:hypothetical protein [Moritella marina]QFI37580.1 hypothetical protein FR932_06865 [Moritella marina ATCC 15381]